MLLALSVISAQGRDLGPTAYKVFDEYGGSIGRLENNDWTLPDPEKFVSTCHARIRCEEGAYFLDDNNSERLAMPHNNREELVQTLRDEIERNHVEHFGHS